MSRKGRGAPAQVRAEQDAEQGEQRHAADPGLDAVPAAGDQRARQRRQPRADRAERGAGEHRIGHAVARAGMADQQHRDEHDDIAEQHGRASPASADMPCSTSPAASIQPGTATIIPIQSEA